MPFNKRDFIATLERKFGFEQVDGSDHDAYAFFYDGRKIATTRFSRSHRDIDDTLLTQIARQIRVHDRKFLNEMVSCTRSREDFLQRLRDGGFM